jgi:hypothetical protein
MNYTQILQACELALDEFDAIGTNIDPQIYYRPAYKALKTVITNIRKEITKKH